MLKEKIKRIVVVTTALVFMFSLFLYQRAQAETLTPDDVRRSYFTPYQTVENNESDRELWPERGQSYTDEYEVHYERQKPYGLPITVLLPTSMNERRQDRANGFTYFFATANTNKVHAETSIAISIRKQAQLSDVRTLASAWKNDVDYKLQYHQEKLIFNMSDYEPGKTTAYYDPNVRVYVQEHDRSDGYIQYTTPTIMSDRDYEDESLMLERNKLITVEEVAQQAVYRSKDYNADIERLTILNYTFVGQHEVCIAVVGGDERKEELQRLSEVIVDSIAVTTSLEAPHTFSHPVEKVSLNSLQLLLPDSMQAHASGIWNDVNAYRIYHQTSDPLDVHSGLTLLLTRYDYSMYESGIPDDALDMEQINPYRTDLMRTRLQQGQEHKNPWQYGNLVYMGFNTTKDSRFGGRVYEEDAKVLMNLAGTESEKAFHYSMPVAARLMLIEQPLENAVYLLAVIGGEAEYQSVMALYESIMPTISFSD